MIHSMVVYLKMILASQMILKIITSLTIKIRKRLFLSVLSQIIKVITAISKKKVTNIQNSITKTILIQIKSKFIN
jgi:hypothetical protein